MQSRILRADEHSTVTPVWWRDTAPATVLQSRSREVAAPVEQSTPEQDQNRDQTLARERERIERDAYQRGFSEGKGVGREQAAAELQPVLDRLARTLAELSSLRSGIRK